MYVAVTKDGYTIYEKDVTGWMKEIEKLRTGEIYIRFYNRHWDNIRKLFPDTSLKKGEIVDNDLLVMQNEKGLKGFEIPAQNYFEKNYTERDMERANFIPSAVIKLKGEFVQLFDVEDLYELYIFDTYRMQQEGVKVKNCEHCDKLFFVNKNQIYCDECIENRIPNKEKHIRMKADQCWHEKRKLKQILRNFHKGRNDYQDIYVKRLKEIIEPMNQKDVERMRMIHYHFKILDDAACNDSFPDYYIDKWMKERFTIWHQSDPEAWLRSWYDDLDLEW